MKKILVTGGAGYIGIHICLLLLEQEFDVVIVDSLTNSNENSIKRLFDYKNKNLDIKNSTLQFYKGDIRDLQFLRKVFLESGNSGNSIDNVIHLAGLKSVSQSIDLPRPYWEVNVYGTLQILKVMEEFECKNFVFSSSATIYSQKQASPLNENAQISPINPYGKTKATVEEILKDFSKIKKQFWNFISLRYFNPIGAHPSGMFGEDPIGTPNNLFPYICQVGSSRRDTLSIFGNNWPTNDGTCIRDFIHIMDLADGHIAALNFLNGEIDKVGSFIAVNLGTGVGTSVLELVEIFEKVNKLKINTHFTSRRLGDKAVVYANPELAHKVLNWTSKRNIEDMCRDGWNWQLKNPSGY